jgi:hypothetical protein
MAFANNHETGWEAVWAGTAHGLASVVADIIFESREPEYDVGSNIRSFFEGFAVGAAGVAFGTAAGNEAWDYIGAGGVAFVTKFADSWSKGHTLMESLGEAGANMIVNMVMRLYLRHHPSVARAGVNEEFLHRILVVVVGGPIEGALERIGKLGGIGL